MLHCRLCADNLSKALAAKSAMQQARTAGRAEGDMGSPAAQVGGGSNSLWGWGAGEATY